MNKYLIKVAAKLPSSLKEGIREQIHAEKESLRSNLTKKESQTASAVYKGISKQGRTLAKQTAGKANLYSRSQALIGRVMSAHTGSMHKLKVIK